jgi:hypothetical protein
MKRVTETNAFEFWDRLNLKVLAALLNFDWESEDPKAVEKLTKEFRGPYRGIIQNALDNREKAKTVQAELKTDLVPIFAAEGEVTPEEASLRIEKLIRKLNEVDSKAEWNIDPIDYEWTPIDPGDEETGDLVLRPLDPDEIEKNLALMNAREELNLLGYRWCFRRKGLSFGFSRETLYVMILEAFERGAIARFRTCPHCKNFFVADDARQQFCSDEHRNEFNNAKRLQSGYFSDLRRKRRTADLKRARALKREGKSPTEIQKQTGLSLRVLKRERIVH